MDEPLSKGDQARVEILEAARALFLSQGYNGTSMRAIAREAGDRAVAGIYNHFPTKEAIFKALIEERNPYEELFIAIESVEGDTAPDVMRSILRVVFQVMPRHYDFFELTQIDAREFEGQHMKHILQALVFPRVMGVVARIQALPGLKPVDGVVLIRLMASLVIGFIITENLAPDTLFTEERSRPEWADRFIDALLYGLAAPDGAQS